MTSLWLVSLMLGTSAVIYLVTAGGYLSLRRPGMCVAFLGYVLANAGIIWDAIQMGKH